MPRLPHALSVSAEGCRSRTLDAPLRSAAAVLNGESLLVAGLALDGHETPAKLMERAHWCSRWAKQVDGRTRKVLYHGKNLCLAALRRRFPNRIRERVDHARYWGLPTIGLADGTLPPLHTHDNWLDLDSRIRPCKGSLRRRRSVSGFGTKRHRQFRRPNSYRGVGTGDPVLQEEGTMSC